MENGLKKFGIWTVSVIGGLYILFLILPVFISPLLNSQAKNIEQFIKESTGYSAELDKISVVTSWNFAAGIKVKNLNLSMPNEDEPFLETENIGVKLSLLPILRGKIELDSLFADDVEADVIVKKDGTLHMLDCLPKSSNPKPETFDMPFGLKLSNHLPEVTVKSYQLSMIDKRSDREYTLQGENFKITNFVLDKKVKISAKGDLTFDNVLISQFDIKIDNRIMPDIKLHDIVFNSEPSDQEQPVAAEEKKFSLLPFIDFLEGIKNNGFGANIYTNIKTSGSIKNPVIIGDLIIDSISVCVNGKKLPQSYFKLLSKGNKTTVSSAIFSSFDANEKTEFSGEIKHGKRGYVDLFFTSNAKFQNIINLVNSIAKSFNIKDFQTLSATGGIDARFNIKSDFKKVNSDGYLKILPSTLSYGLYNVRINDILADVNLENNNIYINKAGFSILNQPLNLSGKILSDATADLKLVADKLSLKGLLAATGQLALLKENTINSGTISADAILKGKIQEIKPEIFVSIDGINLYNKAAQAKLTLKKALVKILYDGKTASGNADIDSAKINMSGSNIAVPKAVVSISPNEIDINNLYFLLNNSRIDVKGGIKDYLSEKLSIDITAGGNLKSSDVATFLPKDFRTLITFKGAMPVKAVITGNSKVQNIAFDLSADPNNYLSLMDLKSLKGQRANIHSNIEINGDTLSFINTNLSNSGGAVATLSGGINKLTTSPALNLKVVVPSVQSFPVWGVPNSNISAHGSVGVSGSIDNPQLKGTVYLPDISIKDMNFAISDLTADLSGDILNGNATAKKFKFDGIVASDLKAKISLKNYSKFYITDGTAKAFDGNVKGKISYDIPTTVIGMEFSGSGLDSMKAVEGAVGIKKALTGTMNFDGKLTTKGVTDKEIIKSLKGNINFDINNGRFVSIGKLENLVAAQNVTSNAILKSVISALSTLSAVQESDRFKYIKGEVLLSNGVANLSKILVSGPLMSYYVKGSYNILPNTANMVILGRLESKVVSILGPLGQLSADKLLGYIPKFGTATANILKMMTADPANERTELIPELSGGSKNYKDFKVIFNGNVESSSSVRSFKWLSNCDTTEIDIEKELQNAVDAAKTNVTTTIENTKNTVKNVQTNVENIVENKKKQMEAAKKDLEQAKNDLKYTKEDAKQSAENLQNLFKNVIQNANKRPEVQSENQPETTDSSAQPAEEEGKSE